MKSPIPRIMALDDSRNDLDLLAASYPDLDIDRYIIDVPAGSTALNALDGALSHLERYRPTVLIVDLLWYDGEQYFDGIRFLRKACEQNLLKSVSLVIWSRYLQEASHLIRNLVPDFGRAQLRNFMSLAKTEIPPLRELVG